MKFDTIVLGAGIVGVSIAVHLQKRGRSVALVDRKPPGRETSFGNAGLLQREGVYPYALPRDLRTLLHYARNDSIDIHYHRSALLKLAPFLLQYWRNSEPARHAAIARLYAPLIEHSVVEHETLARDAGIESLLRPIGWIKVFHKTATLDRELRVAQRWHSEYGVQYRALDRSQLQHAEPHLSRALVGGLHYTDAVSISDPGALVEGYAAYFERLGGRFFIGDANTLDPTGNTWRVLTQEGSISASSAVVALGPWAKDVTTALGYRLPLEVKRGYHMHYVAQAGAVLNHPVLDLDNGFLLAPMTRGIRLTTGAELAQRDAPQTPVQLKRAEPHARSLFPLVERIDAEPWMGRRPCTPDMMPVIGPAPRHKNLWFAFGHAHHGLTLGAVTGRMIAEMMTGEEPVIDATPYRAERFGAA
jgi:D-amino-acid dehydrogenase